MKLPRSILEWLIFGGGGGRRYTQGSPVLPDVWIGYGQSPGESLELLLTPHRQASAGEVAVALRRRLGLGERGKTVEEQGHRIAYTPSSVAARLSLAEVVLEVLPMTSWWKGTFWKDGKNLFEEVRGELGLETLADLKAYLARELAKLDELPKDGDGGARARAAAPLRRWAQPPGEKRSSALLPPDLVWMMRIVGWLAWAEKGTAKAGEEKAARRRPARKKTLPDPEPGQLDAWRRQHSPPPLAVIDAVFELVGGELPPPESDDQARVFQVNRNRSAELAVVESRQAVKADAAERLFEISCGRLNWAIIDSGIDATHPAFRKRNPKDPDPQTGEPRPYPDPFGDDPDKPRNQTRVVATYDFTRVRTLLNPSNLDPKRLPPELADLEPLIAGEGESALRLHEQLEDLRKRLQFGREIDWELLEPFLAVRHAYGKNAYWYPESDHGTHVAGILAADWPRPDHPDGDMKGVCPDLSLYDLRVLPRGAGGPDDEFNVIAALQFVRHLNLQKNYQVVHGVNLSLAIPHEVANFACGRTPVCEECERVVASGVVTVAAAGNNGYLRYRTSEGETEGYHTLSVTDPGNAAGVITVGATHRNRPHTYGVSYFSSRGPTGDGRSKPDLVAPGEKITAPVLDDAEGEKDGTSMAAPHVSGAAAMLMARYNELIGRPAEIKRILCDSATDLGRERYFQGAGMLDALRALQSV
jgi:serine protease AprX